MNEENANLSRFLATLPKSDFKKTYIGYNEMISKFTVNDTILSFIKKLSKSELNIVKKYGEDNPLFQYVKW